MNITCAKGINMIARPKMDRNRKRRGRTRLKKEKRTEEITLKTRITHVLKEIDPGLDLAANKRNSINTGTGSDLHIVIESIP
jgi:hypothetical protein